MNLAKCIEQPKIGNMKEIDNTIAEMETKRFSNLKYLGEKHSRLLIKFKKLGTA